MSSLLEITSINVQASFPTRGMCYRTNCFKPDYLQVAVVDPFLLKFLWFKCPKEGGKMYIPKYEHVVLVVFRTSCSYRVSLALVNGLSDESFPY